MGWSTGDDLAAQVAEVSAFLASDPVEHTAQASILDTLASGVSWSDDPPVFAVHRDPDGRVDAAAVRTPPHPLVLDGPARLAPQLAQDLATALGDRPVLGVNAPVPLATAFADAWCPSRGLTAHLHHRLHLLALPSRAALREPEPSAGVVRPATTADVETLVEIDRAMREEIGESGSSPTQMLRDAVAAGLLFVLEDASGLVATARAGAVVAGTSRIAFVYTRPAARGRGHAATLTATVTRAAYDAGAEHVCLFTDAANPTSNRVYERLGYVRRRDDRVVLQFEPR